MKIATASVHIYAQRGQLDGTTNTTITGSEAIGSQPRQAETGGPGVPSFKPPTEEERDAIICTSSLAHAALNYELDARLFIAQKIIQRSRSESKAVQRDPQDDPSG